MTTTTRMMMVELTGSVAVVSMRLHAVLLALILMTQYFTSVTTSVSLLSPSSSSSSSSQRWLSASSSSLPVVAVEGDSQKSFSSLSLPLPLSSLPSSSSSSSLWPTLQSIHHSTVKNFHSLLAPNPPDTSSSTHYFNHHQHHNSYGEDEHVPISRRQKHQKRHASSGGGGGGGGESRNNSTRVSSSQSQVTALDFPTPSVFPEKSDSNSSSHTNQSDSVKPSAKSKIHFTVEPLNIILDEDVKDLSSMCRHGDRGYMPTSIFYLDTCAYCYRYMKDDLPTFGKPSSKLPTVGTIEQGFPLLRVLWNNTLIVANISDLESPIWNSFANAEAKKDWSGCCQAARECCERMVYSSMSQKAAELVQAQAELDGTAAVPSSVAAMTALNLELGVNATVAPVEKYCPPTWDGWQCWNSTKAGVTAKSYCPNYIYVLIEPPSCSIPVHKECADEGYWAKKDGSGREWTNYAVCALSTVKSQSNRAYVLVTAYAISIVALVPAVLIFFTFKQLRVHRIILHQNLFFSLLLNALLVIIFKTSVMMSEANTAVYGSASGSDPNSTVARNTIWCRILLLSTKYSRMTNYMWMLCEGFYLHKLIAAAFAEQKSLLVFYMIGWVFPLFPTAFYAGFRIIYANDNCWVVPQEEWEWALNGPSLLSLLVNTLFLINIIRVLVTKLRAAHAQEPSQYRFFNKTWRRNQANFIHIRKAVRATLVLLPLFGLHFIVTIYRPPSTTGVCGTWAEYYFYMNDILDGMQGFLVALIFCYCNGEVLSLLKRAYIRWKEQHFDVGRRQNSRHRPSRGSVLGRSVVSTHIYSSIPPSPETNVIAVPCGGSTDLASKDPSPSTTTAIPTALTVNGASGTGSSNVHVILNSSTNGSGTTTTATVSPPNGKKSVLKNRKNTNHTSATNGNAVNMYVSSEYGCLKENPGVEISCV